MSLPFSPFSSSPHVQLGEQPIKKRHVQNHLAVSLSPACVWITKRTDCVCMCESVKSISLILVTINSNSSPRFSKSQWGEWTPLLFQQLTWTVFQVLSMKEKKKKSKKVRRIEDHLGFLFVPFVYFEQWIRALGVSTEEVLKNRDYIHKDLVLIFIESVDVHGSSQK